MKITHYSQFEAIDAAEIEDALFGRHDAPRDIGG